MKTIAELLGCDVFTAYFFLIYAAAQFTMFAAYLAKGANVRKKFYNWMMGANSAVTALCVVTPIFDKAVFNIGLLFLVVFMACFVGMFVNYILMAVARDFILWWQKKRQS